MSRWLHRLRANGVSAARGGVRNLIRSLTPPLTTFVVSPQARWRGFGCGSAFARLSRTQEEATIDSRDS